MLKYWKRDCCALWFSWQMKGWILLEVGDNEFSMSGSLLFMLREFFDETLLYCFNSLGLLIWFLSIFGCTATFAVGAFSIVTSVSGLWFSITSASKCIKSRLGITQQLGEDKPGYLSCDWRRRCGEGGLLTDHGREQGQAGRDKPQARALLLKLLRRAGITFLRCSAAAAVRIQSLKHLNNECSKN